MKKSIQKLAGVCLCLVAISATMLERVVAAEHFQDILPKSDVFVSLPYSQAPVYEGLVGSVEGNAVALGSGSLVYRAFNQSTEVPNHYLYVKSGELRGRWYDIVSNKTDSVILDADSLIGLSEGDMISIRPHWTLGSAFPSGIALAEETEAGIRKIELILVSNSTGAGLVATRVYYFYNESWRKFGRCSCLKYDSVVLYPGSAFIIRNNSEAMQTAVYFGEAELSELATPLYSSDTLDIENFVGTGRSAPVAISDLGLIEGGAFGVTANAEVPLDTLLVYSNSEQGKNKQARARYYFFENAWRKLGENPTIEFGDDLIEAGAGFGIRKVAGVEAVSYWSRP